MSETPQQTVARAATEVQQPGSGGTSEAHEATRRAAFDAAVARQRAAGEPATSSEAREAPPPDSPEALVTGGREKPQEAPEPAADPAAAAEPEEPAGAATGDEGDDGAVDSGDPFANMTPSQYRAHLADRETLRRDGLDDDDLDELIERRGLEAFSARAARRREHHRETDRAFSGGAQGGRREEGRATDAEPAGQPGNPQQSARDAFRPLMDDLGLDGAEADRFARTLDAEIARRAQEAAGAALEPVRQAWERQVLDGLHGQYRGTVPDVATWVAVEDKARALMRTGEYDALPAAIPDAIRLVTGKNPARATSGDGQARDPESGKYVGQQRRRNGAVPKPVRSKPSKSKLSPEQMRRAAFDASLRGDHKRFYDVTGQLSSELQRRSR